MTDNPIITFDSPIVWIIIILAVICYSLLIHITFLSEKNKLWFHSALEWSKTVPAMLGALPLLGLLGTIVGLLQTFKAISKGGGLELQELISSGIADALFTTQLGLLLVVPGWVMALRLDSLIDQWRSNNADDIL